ncbi:MAG: hypothetical protein L6265_02780 [Thermoplasmatales archaeon]|nr:hypothetical protein [Candidatus Methanoperedenaceae archaeon]MCG2825501.1 hypothetical protein [Thermoplasmatales archaeon]
MNIQMILNEVKVDPLIPLLRKINSQLKSTLMANDVTLYTESFQFYYLTLERLLNEMSLARRFRNGPHYALKYGAKYTPQEKKLAQKFHNTKRYFDLDFVDFLIHSRILLDRSIALSKYFLTEKTLPSFVSFNRHKKFFQNPSHRPYGNHERYAHYVCDETNWFDQILKPVRDKFLVHPQQNHTKFFGLPDSGPSEIEMTIILPCGSAEKPLAKVDYIRVSIVELVDNIQDFLRFFSSYGRDILRG